MLQTLWAWRFTILIGAVLAAAAFIDQRGYTRCEKNIEVAALRSETTTRKALNEVRNNRPDTAPLIERLQRGDF